MNRTLASRHVFAALRGGLALSVAVGGAQARAEDASVAFNAGVASNYVFRGVSQTDKAAQVFADHRAADFRYHDTDEHGFGSIYGGRAVVSLKASF